MQPAGPVARPLGTVRFLAQPQPWAGTLLAFRHCTVICGPPVRALENTMLKFLGIVIAIIFIIGLLVVMGVFKLIF